ncbi:hypothetical protein Csa_020276 [Cucumis sativus]|uniref:Uncharacterized protein n=1 Tax=Cucumis sativus TaxID=3659 RepID=A0A0A0K4H6_CUCSA|nr:hypothetical protein Csa_020276 [Cucumis sativus]
MEEKEYRRGRSEKRIGFRRRRRRRRRKKFEKGEGEKWRMMRRKRGSWNGGKENLQQQMQWRRRNADLKRIWKRFGEDLIESEIEERTERERMVVSSKPTSFLPSFLPSSSF